MRLGQGNRCIHDRYSQYYHYGEGVAKRMVMDKLFFYPGWNPLATVRRYYEAASAGKPGYLPLWMYHIPLNTFQTPPILRTPRVGPYCTSTRLAFTLVQQQGITADLFTLFYYKSFLFFTVLVFSSDVSRRDSAPNHRSSGRQSRQGYSAGGAAADTGPFGGSPGKPGSGEE